MKKRIIGMALTLVLSMGLTVSAMAAPNDPKDVKGQGKIYATTEEALLVDIQVPGSFLWYADSSTKNTTTNKYDIVSGSYNIKNHSDKVNLEVKLLGYAVTAGSSSTIDENKVDLNLTGDLRQDDLGKDLFNSSNSGTYLTALNVGDEWTFGFAGTYDATALPATAQLGDYTLQLEFTASSVVTP